MHGALQLTQTVNVENYSFENKYQYQYLCLFAYLKTVTVQLQKVP